MDDLDALIARLKELIDLASDGLIADLSKHAEFQAIMEELLTRYHIAAYMLGADTDTVSEEARRVVVAGVARQLAFLERFVTEIQSEEEFRAGWAARARSYAESVKEPYWTGRVKMLPLPAMPGDGTTQCLGNCRCEWEIEQTGADSYAAYWRLSNAEHCQTCVQRAMEWNPLRVIDGELQL